MAMSNQGKDHMSYLISYGELLYNQGSLDSLILFRRFIDEQEENEGVEWSVNLIKETLDELIKSKSDPDESQNVEVEKIPDKDVSVIINDGTEVKQTEDGVTINFGENGIPLITKDISQETQTSAMEDIMGAVGGVLGGMLGADFGNLSVTNEPNESDENEDNNTETKEETKE